jgi:hypothetical protein
MRAQEDRSSQVPDKYAHIPGWGIDADPDNDPQYPMRSNPTEQHKGYSWERPTQQEETVEVFHSIERPNLTAVFGTTCPPRGLSGLIRRWAFKSSENRYSHWLPLLLADRIDAVEGIIIDLARGRVPNYVKEKGWTALWKYDKKKLMKRVGPAIAIIAGGIAWLIGKSVKLPARMYAGV